MYRIRTTTSTISEIINKAKRITLFVVIPETFVICPTTLEGSMKVVVVFWINVVGTVVDVIETIDVVVTISHPIEVVVIIVVVVLSTKQEMHGPPQSIPSSP